MKETISLDDMRVFAAVARAGSFSAAARDLKAPKQTVSRRIAALETALGVQLLQRTTRSMSLTEDGALYLRRCEDIVARADDANRELLDRVAGQATGVLRLSADPVFADFFLGDVITQYLDENPMVTIDLDLTARHVDIVAEGFDAAIRVGALPDSSLIARRLGSAKIRYCASPAYAEVRGLPEKPADLAAHDCVVQRLGADPPRWPFRGAKGPQWVPVSGRFFVNDFRMALNAVHRGLGIGLFPAFICDQAITDGTLVPVLDDWLIQDFGGIYVVYAKPAPPSRKLSAFLDMVTKAFSGEAPWEGHNAAGLP